MFVGRVIPNKKFEDVIRAFHAYRTRHNPRSRLLLVGSYSGFERYLAMLHGARRAARHAGRPLPRPRLERGADGALRRRRSVPVRQRARRLLRAAHRGVLQAGAGAGLRGHGGAGDDGRRRRAVRHEGSAATIARLMDAVLDDADARGGGRRSRRTPRSSGCARRTSAARCSRFVDQMLATAAAPAPEVAVRLLAAVRPVRAARGAAPVQARRCIRRCLPRRPAVAEPPRTDR